MIILAHFDILPFIIASSVNADLQISYFSLLDEKYSTFIQLQQYGLCKAATSPPVPMLLIRDYLRSLPHQPNSPESRGTSVMPMRATPPPAMSCFMPCDFAHVR